MFIKSVFATACMAVIAAPAAAQTEVMPVMSAEAQAGCAAYQFLLADLMTQEDKKEEAADRMLRAQRWFAYYRQEQNITEEAGLAKLDNYVQILLALLNGSDADRDELAGVGTECVMLEEEYDEQLKIAKIKQDLTK